MTKPHIIDYPEDRRALIREFTIMSNTPEFRESVRKALEAVLGKKVTEEEAKELCPVLNKVKVSEECLYCERPFDLEMIDGANGSCPHCGREYTIGKEDGYFTLYWYTGLNINDFPELKDEAS